MIVAMIAMGMVKVTVDKVVDVVAVRYRFVPASGTVNVVRIVPLTGVSGRAAARIGVGDFQGVFFDLAVGSDVMQVTVVEVVDVVAVLNSGVFAVRTVLVVVIAMQIRHVKVPYLGLDSSIACMTPLVTKREMCSSASA